MRLGGSWTQNIPSITVSFFKIWANQDISDISFAFKIWKCLFQTQPFIVKNPFPYQMNSEVSINGISPKTLKNRKPRKTTRVFLFPINLNFPPISKKNSKNKILRIAENSTPTCAFFCRFPNQFDFASAFIK